jgi:hypothetical protein
MPIRKRKPFVPRRPTRRTPTPNDIDTLQSALMMFTLSLQPGSNVDIFCKVKNCFYEAIVATTEGGGGGFRYMFKDKQSDQGFVRFKDCLHTWRPPMSKTHLTPQTLLLMYDALNPI